ncbi:hypothetical protein Bca4012_017066 [Brassica carinata]
MSVPSTCLLCGAADETRDHIYFECSYSRSVWDFLFSQGNLNQPYTFTEVIRWVHHSTPSGKLRTICKLTVQAAFYTIWNERNKRLHTAVARHTQCITREIQIILKAKLYGMDQDVRNINRFGANRPIALKHCSSRWKLLLQLCFSLLKAALLVSYYVFSETMSPLGG